MAGKIIADTIEASGSQISLNVGNVTVFMATSTGLATANITTANITTANITTANITGNLLVGTTTAQTGAKLAVTGGIQGTITSGTTVASTSGTSIDFTSIPSWVKRITVLFNGVSTNGASIVLVRLGTSSGVVATGYLGTVDTSTTATAAEVITTGLATERSGAASSAMVRNGLITWCAFGNNTWSGSVSVGNSGGGQMSYGASSIPLGGTLDRVRITTANGTDTFDAGSINILYEG
jgi:hypothetical protein